MSLSEKKFTNKLGEAYVDFDDTDAATASAIATYEDSLRALTSLIDLVLTQQTGLAILLGLLPAPSAYDLYVWKSKAPEDLGVHVDGGERAGLAETVMMATRKESAILRLLGRCADTPRMSESYGWKRITGGFCEYKKKFPETWLLFEEYVIFVQPGGIYHDGKGGMTGMLSRRNDGADARTLRRRKKRFLEKIASFILAWQPGDEFFLRG